MTKIKFLFSAILVSVLPFITFGQAVSDRASRFDTPNENGVAIPGHPSPVNQYEIALIIMAVSIVAFLAYKFYKSKQIAK